MSQLETVASFIDGAPPGEVRRHHYPSCQRCAKLLKLTSAVLYSLPMSLPVRTRCFFTDTYQERIETDKFYPSIDIKTLTASSPNLLSQLGPAFQKYNEEQLITVKLPGGSQSVGQFCHINGRGLLWMLMRAVDRFLSANTTPWAMADTMMSRARPASPLTTSHRCAAVCSRDCDIR